MTPLFLASIIALSPAADRKPSPVTALNAAESASAKSNPWKTPELPSRLSLSWSTSSEAAKGINPDVLKELASYAFSTPEGATTKAKVTVKIQEYEEKSGMIYIPGKTRGRALVEISIRSEDGRLLYVEQQEVLVKGSDMGSSLTDTIAKVTARKIFSAIPQQF